MASLRKQMGFFKVRGFGGRGGSHSAGGPAAHLNLTPMVDLLTIILVFLIKTYSVTPAFLTPTQGIALAETQSESEAPDKAVLIVGKNGIMFEGKVVVAFVNGELPAKSIRGGELPELRSALEAVAAKTKFIASKNSTVEFTGTLILQADKELPFDSLKPVLRTAGMAGFHDIKFAGVFLD